MDDYDVVVVGGGPVGLLTARDIAREGLEVCVLEKSQEIGYPVKCSGLFSLRGLEQINVSVPDELVCSTIRGGRFYPPGGEEFLAYSRLDRARVVERKMFDKLLAKEAIRAGAKVMLKTKVTDVKRSEDGFKTKINSMGDEKILTSRLLIGADGSGSNVARWMGIKRKQRFVSGIQVEVPKADIEDDVAEVYFGKKVAPGFYAWILPKGDVYEVGLGTDGSGGNDTPSILLDRFLKENPLVNGKVDPHSILEFNKGAIPVGGPGETVSEGVMLVGDAAGQTKASTGGGVITGGLCGRLASNAAVLAVQENDFSREFLQESYERKWQKELGKEFMAHIFLKSIIDSAKDDELDELFRLIVEEDIPGLMTTYTDTDRPLDFVREVLKNDRVLNWTQRFLDVRKELLG